MRPLPSNRAGLRNFLSDKNPYPPSALTPRQWSAVQSRRLPASVHAKRRLVARLAHELRVSFPSAGRPTDSAAETAGNQHVHSALLRKTSIAGNPTASRLRQSATAAASF